MMTPKQNIPNLSTIEGLCLGAKKYEVNFGGKQN